MRISLGNAPEALLLLALSLPAAFAAKTPMSDPWASADDGCEAQTPCEARFLFPVAGVRRAYTGRTAATAPSEPGRYVVANRSDWYHEWPTPAAYYPYEKHKGQAKVGKNQEPGFFACRPTPRLPKGCGRPHRGIDIYARYGTPIVAPEKGTDVAYGGSDVFVAAGKESENGGQGRVIEMTGDSGYTFVFMHTMGLSEALAAAAGVRKDFGNTEKTAIRVPVNAGDLIAYVGRTGGIINPHLHLEIRKSGRLIDPAALLDPRTEGRPRREREGERKKRKKGAVLE